MIVVGRVLDRLKAVIPVHRLNVNISRVFSAGLGSLSLVHEVGLALRLFRVRVVTWCIGLAHARGSDSSRREVLDFARYQIVIFV